MLDMIISTVTQGLIYALLSYGIFITYKILDFPDLTVDGSFPLGAAVTGNENARCLCQAIFARICIACAVKLHKLCKNAVVGSMADGNEKACNINNALFPALSDLDSSKLTLAEKLCDLRFKDKFNIGLCLKSLDELCLAPEAVPAVDEVRKLRRCSGWATIQDSRLIRQLR